MTPKRFMQLVERGKAAAIEHAEPRMVSAYRAALRAAGRRASAAFTEHAHPLTASANPPTFGEPDPDEVLDIRLLLLEAQERAKPGRKAALRHVVSQVLSEGGIAFDVGGIFATELLEAAGGRVSSELGRSARNAVVGAIETAANEGFSIPQAAAAIQEAVYGIADYTATMLARTDLIGIANGGSIGSARQIFGETAGITKVWLATEDERVRETHADADGQEVPMEHPFTVGDADLDYPGDPDGPDEEVINCFPGETLVIARNVDMGFRRRYDGPVTIVETDARHLLAGTPNHPVLTSAGWKRMRDLEKGDYLVCGAFREDEARIAPDVDHAPSAIKDVFSTLAHEGHSRRVAGRAVQFHGDVSECEVEVVTTDGQLRYEDQTSFEQPILEQTFVRTREVSGLATSSRPAREIVFGAGFATNRVMRGAGQASALNGASAGHPNEHRLRSVARLDAELQETPSDGGAADAIELGERLLGDAFAVSLAKIVKIDVDSFHGDVYNLQTDSGAYLASGIISHNCRCTLTFNESAGALTAAGDTLPHESQEDTMSVIEEDLTAATVITITQDGETPAAPAAPANWVSDVAFEGTATSDGRYILPDALTWRDPPLTLMALIETGPGGHEGAEAAGRMDTFQKDSAQDMNGDQLPTGVVAVRSTGIFDMEGEYGAEIARMVDEQIITGVSVDLAILDWCFRDPATGQLLEPADMSEADWERAFYDELQFAVRKAEILATTVCPTPAFADASIALTASSPPRRQDGAIHMTLFSPIQSAPDPADALTASAAGAAPDFPPRDWFSIAEADVPTPLTVDDDGRVYGHLAVWGTCHTGNPRGFGVCTQPPRNNSGYSMFHLGKVRTAEGDDLAVGQITLSENGAGHAAYGLKPDAVTRHYDDTGTAMADIRAVDGKLGIWVSGALRPDATMGQIREMRGGKLSGDWRKVQGRTELMGALLVNVPGFPVPQAQAVLASAAGGEDVLALTAAGIVGVLDPAEAEMRIQVLGARALGGIHGLAALARS